MSTRCRLLVLAIVVASACGRAVEPPASGRLAEDARPAFGGDFTLTNQDGQPFRLDQMRASRRSVLWLHVLS